MSYVPGTHDIELASGAYLDLSDPQPVMTAGDVAHGLANACRFAGQSQTFYSVAEHAVVVADRLRQQGFDTLTVLAGLHHDDAEAFIGDVTRPLKAMLTGYRELEHRVTRTIERALGLAEAFDDLTSYGGDAVKAADDWALSVESYYLMPSMGVGWFCEGLFEPGDQASMEPEGLSPPAARDQWLRWHRTIMAEWRSE